MTTKKLNGDKPILFLGDNHGEWNTLFALIDSKSIADCYIISVGDLGIGFKYKKEYEYSQSEKLSDFFKEKNINFFGIRGNHDNPVFFKGKDRICLENFELIADYSVFEYKSKLIQFIGGAISIDRSGRKQGVSYWENECVVFNKEACQKVDILVTHTAPSWCFPQQFNEMVYGWAREDAYLLEDLTDERHVMDAIFKICNPKQHFYGHFHSSRVEKINGCTSRLLAINEIYELI